MIPPTGVQGFSTAKCWDAAKIFPKYFDNQIGHNTIAAEFFGFFLLLIFLKPIANKWTPVYSWYFDIQYMVFLSYKLKLGVRCNYRLETQKWDLIRHAIE